MERAKSISASNALLTTELSPQKSVPSLPFYSSLFCIEPSFIANMLHTSSPFLDTHFLLAPSASLSSYQNSITDVPPEVASVKNGIMVIRAKGELVHRPQKGLFLDETTSYLHLQQAFRQAATRQDVKAVVFDVDSVGGEVKGVVETAEEIRETKKHKPVITTTQGSMLSAAYWLGSQADYIIASETAKVGSIGAFSLHQDLSEYLHKLGVKYTIVKAGSKKALGLPFFPLEEDARKRMQYMVSKVYDRFVSDVEASRRITAPKEVWASGDVFDAEEARQYGLIDAISKPRDFDTILLKLQSKT